MKPRATKRLRAVLVGVALGLVALELAMQVVAYLAWRQGDGFRVRAVDSRTRVLCVGDSFTFGLGAGPERGYPQQLEALLRGEGRELAVVNAGKPGQDSAAVLRRLPRQLEIVQPTELLVLVGYNDRWSHPQAVTEEELTAARGAEGFPLRLRTGTFAALLAHALFGGESSDGDAAPAFLGTWHAGDFEIELGADGALRVAERRSRWQLEGEELLLSLELDKVTRARWRIVGDRLQLEMEPGKPALEFERGAAATRPADRARRHLERGESAAAEAIVSAALAGDPGDVELRALAVGLAHRAGRDVSAELAGLRAAAEGGAEREVTALVEALFETGASEEGVARACAWLRTRPHESRLWWALTRHVAARELSDQAILATIDAALPLLGEGEVWRAALLRLRAGVLRNGRREPVAALASAFAAALVDGNKAHAVTWLQSGEFSSAEADAALASLDLDKDSRAKLAAWRAEAARGESGANPVLGRHLRRIASLCRDRGTRLFLLTYPEDEGGLGQVIRDVAREEGATLIDCEDEFRGELRGTSRDALFVADGHCNEAGYGVMARRAAQALRAFVR